MDNVWIAARGTLWLPIAEWFRKNGYWNKVILRGRPTIDECIEKRAESRIPPDQVKAHEAFYESILKDRYLLLDRLYRKTDWGTGRYNSASFHELSGRIRIYFDYFMHILPAEDIKLVIFWNTPHMGWSNILYEVAVYYDIKTLILDQSKFPNRFFHYTDYYDYGHFNTSKTLDKLKTVAIERKAEKDWFYMKKNYGRKTRVTFKKLITPEKYATRLSRFIEKNDVLRLVKELCIRRSRSQAFFRYYTERDYKKAYKKMASDTCDLSQKFVYFPLHNQPERATSIWGGQYLDQALALERLSRLIPENWFIYVKESPKQKGAYRDRIFYARLRQIPNLIYLSDKANTYDLIKNAQFVSTIVGTVAWEAITGGKNVLCFGWGRWYKTFPGVYDYHPDMDISPLVNQPVDHELLEKRLAWLLNKCGTGIIYEPYAPSVPDFNIKTNTETVTASLIKILYENTSELGIG